MNYVKFRISNIGDFLKYEKFRKWERGFNGLLRFRGFTTCFGESQRGN
jgi:hypothetical protein